MQRTDVLRPELCRQTTPSSTQLGAPALRDAVDAAGRVLAPDPAQVLFTPALPVDTIGALALSVPLRGPTQRWEGDVED